MVCSIKGIANKPDGLSNINRIHFIASAGLNLSILGVRHLQDGSQYIIAFALPAALMRQNRLTKYLYLAITFADNGATR